MRVTKAQLANIVGRDERTLSRWQNDGMPVAEIGNGRGNENTYETADVIEWIANRAANGGKESVKDRLDRIRGDREELALAKDLGEVVIADELVSRFEAMIEAAKTELLNTIPDQIATDLSARYGVEIDEQHIREPIEQALRNMANYDATEDGYYNEPEIEEDTE
ncbi:terminase small subunit [Pseudomonas sp. F1_0610]|uniref:terminase small subunit n=1 Tax=Pseudomonas sp. F1_0610 TaxID=3114284 RepID=UPI0039C21C41